MEEAGEPNTALLRQALSIAGRHKLPVTARSLTQKEYAAAMRREWGCVLGGGALVLVFLPFAFAFGGDGDVQVDDSFDFDLAIAIAPYAFGLALLLWLASFVMKWRAGKGYADPGIKVEVWDEGVTVTSPGQRHTLAFADVAPALRAAGLGSNKFIGITLASPIGPLELDDLGFKSGRVAAAAIVARHAAARGADGKKEGLVVPPVES
jgi:hypothetical protein